MRKIKGDHIRTHNDTQFLGCKKYECYDLDDNAVIVNPKNTLQHNSVFPEQDLPCVFNNLGFILKNPDKVIVEKKPSANPQSQKHFATGQIKYFIKKGFLSQLDFPNNNYSGMETVTVVVKYEDDRIYSHPDFNKDSDEDLKNITLTYYRDIDIT
jgi:hypothetical protein